MDTISGSTPPASPAARKSDGLRAYIIGGTTAVVALVFGLGGWAATTDIAGAVVASGFVVVDSSTKPIQHPTGGVVSQIHVKNGSRVEAGDILIELDKTILEARLRISSKLLDELLIREARLKAERIDAESFEMPAELKERQADRHVSEALVGETSLFQSRRVGHVQLIEQLRQRAIQFREEIAGIEGQIEAKDREIDLIEMELEGLQGLKKKNLVTTNRLVSLERQATRLKGERAELAARAAATKGRISEIEINMLQRTEDRKTEVVKELRDVQSKISETTERKVAASEELDRVRITAPQAGLIHEMQPMTRNAVIEPGQAIMQIVPNDDPLVIEARISPAEIDRVKLGSNTKILFTAFNQRTTPVIDGTVSRISADLTRDRGTGESYFTARIKLPEDVTGQLKGNELMPGMPADLQIRTENRTALSYLLKPFTDQAYRAFRER